MNKIDGYIGVGIQGKTGAVGENGISTLFSNNIKNEEYFFIDSSLNKYLHTKENENKKISDNSIIIPNHFKTNNNTISTNNKIILQNDIFSNTHQNKLLKEDYFLTLLTNKDKSKIMSIKNDKEKINIYYKNNIFNIDSNLYYNKALYSESFYNILFNIENFFSYNNDEWSLNFSFNEEYIKNNIRISFISYIDFFYVGITNDWKNKNYNECRKKVEKNFSEEKYKGSIKEYIENINKELKLYYNYNYNIISFIKIEILLDGYNYNIMHKIEQD